LSQNNTKGLFLTHAEKPHALARGPAWLRSGTPAASVCIALPIGILAALVTTLFRMTIEQAGVGLFGTHADITHIMATLARGWRVLIPTAGAALAGVILWAAQRSKDPAGQDYMQAVSEGDGRIPMRTTLLRSASSLISIVSAGSIGREGAMVQLAALTGSLAGYSWADTATLRLCAACGAAAGLASVYHTPLAGAMFVAEIVLGSITVDRLIPLFTASVAASLTIAAIGNHDAPFALAHHAQVLDTADLALIVPIGIAAGLLAPPFLALLSRGKTAFGRLPLPLPLRMALGGLLMGLIAIPIPEVCGNGYAPIIAILHGQPLSGPVAAVLCAKMAATILIVGSGAVGGIFTPSLFIGAALGSLVSSALPGIHDTTLLSLIGMGAFMAAVSHAPLMAILMVFEMTMNANLLLPLMGGCVIAYTVSRVFRSDSLYSVLNRRHIQLLQARQLEAITLGELLEPVSHNLTPASTLADAQALFGQTRTRYLYVVDDGGKLLGGVSVHRLTARLYQEPMSRTHPVLELCEDAFECLPAACTLRQAWDAFTHTPLERIPVVDTLQNRLLLGTVSKRMLLERIKIWQN
jgi:CIC family chloride channel protein